MNFLLRLMMKEFLYKPLLLSLGVFAFLNSCDKAPEIEKTSQKEVAALPDDARFSPWLSKAELQFKMEQLPADEFFSVIQGRCEKGLNQYRAISEKFPQNQYREWAVFWGLTEKELFEYEITLLRLGFVRHKTQVFTDSSGVALSQLIMLCPLNAEVQATTAVKVLDKNQIDPAIVQQAPVVVSKEGGKAVEPNGGSPAPQLVAPAAVPPAVLVTPADAAVAPAVVAITQADKLPNEDVMPTAALPQPEKTGEPVMEKPVTSPVVNKAEAEIPKAVAVVEEPAADLGKVRRHVVVKGDTLSSICRRYRVSISAVKSANKMTNDFLKLKQVLKIPQP